MMAHAVCEAVLVPRPRHDGSLSLSGLSPHPPSSFCFERIHEAAF